MSLVIGPGLALWPQLSLGECSDKWWPGLSHIGLIVFLVVRVGASSFFYGSWRGHDHPRLYGYVCLVPFYLVILVKDKSKYVSILSRFIMD